MPGMRLAGTASVGRLSARLGSCVLVAWIAMVTCSVADGAAGGYSEKQKLTPPTREVISFGDSVALSAHGTVALIGAVQDGDNGAARVYVRRDGVWTSIQKLTAPAAGPGKAHSGSSLGTSVALSANGGIALIGGPGYGSPRLAGAAWVFVRHGAHWRYFQKLSAPNTGRGKERGTGQFGTAVAVSPNGNRMLIGGPSDHAGAGAAWAFKQTSAGWVLQRKLIAPTQGTSARIGAGGFGSSVALARSGDLALIGAPADQPLADNGSVGAAWVFARSGTTWTDEQKLTAPANGPDQEINTVNGGGEFGSSVAFSGTGATAVIGGDDDNNLAGAAWVYTRADGVWTERQKLTPPSSGPDQEQGDSAQFGASLALSPDASTALIGGPMDGFGTGNNTDVGAAWLFTTAGGSWAEQQKLTAPTTGSDRELNGRGGQGGEFGFSVGLSQNTGTALIGGVDDNDPSFGSPYPDDGGVGAAWIFGSDQ